MSPDGKLVEFIELPQSQHRFFVGTQAHPEFKSSLLRPAPLFRGFVESCLRKAFWLQESLDRSKDKNKEK